MGLLDPGAAAAIQSLEGVAAVQPTVDARVEYEKGQLTVRGFPLDPVYEPALISGRWFTTTELDEARAVAIVGAPLAEAIGTDVGRILEISTDSAVIQVEIIGIDDSLVQDGKYLWMPLTTVLEFEGLPAPPVYWIETTSSEPEDVDRVAAGIVSLLEQPGRPVIAHARYADLAAARREDKLVGGVIQVLALPILAVGMIGLVSTMTSNVLDRTREIGVLRSLGSVGGRMAGRTPHRVRPGAADRVAVRTCPPRHTRPSVPHLADVHRPAGGGDRNEDRLAAAAAACHPDAARNGDPL
jgi:ABC-type lipoprotein release transport system permease subunit